MKIKVNENSFDISSIKHVTKKFLEVSRCSRGKQRQRNVPKKCAARAKLLFWLIRPIVVFHRSPALPSFEQTINVISRASLLALAKSIYYSYLASRLGELKQKNVFFSAEPRVDFKLVNMQHLQSEE